MRLALPASAALHVAALALLLPHQGGGLSGEAPPIEVELVQMASAGGVPSPPAATAATDATPPADPDKAGTVAPPAAPAQKATPARQAAPAVNLGAGGEDAADLDVTGRNIVPPRPDARHRNMPPAYPAEASRLHQEGMVGLVVHVTASGVPAQVVVAASSGHPSLDHAALAAVRGWRFNPARDGAGPVPFDYALDVRFVIGDRK